MAKNVREKASGEIRESAHRIWLAGLGALSAAETGGGRLFLDLVERGEEFAARTRPTLSSLKSGVRKARRTAEGTWDQLEKTIDKTVSSTLKRLGVPTKREIASLTKRVEELTRKLDGAAKTGRRAPARKRASTRTTRKTGAASRKTGAATRKTGTTARKKAKTRTAKTAKR